VAEVIGGLAVVVGVVMVLVPQPSRMMEQIMMIARGISSLFTFEVSLVYFIILVFP
jgi:hypothetical protein